MLSSSCCRLRSKQQRHAEHLERVAAATAPAAAAAAILRVVQPPWVPPSACHQGQWPHRSPPQRPSNRRGFLILVLVTISGRQTSPVRGKAAKCRTLFLIRTAARLDQFTRQTGPRIPLSRPPPRSESSTLLPPRRRPHPCRSNQRASLPASIGPSPPLVVSNRACTHPPHHRQHHAKGPVTPPLPTPSRPVSRPLPPLPPLQPRRRRSSTLGASGVQAMERPRRAMLRKPSRPVSRPLPLHQRRQRRPLTPAASGVQAIRIPTRAKLPLLTQSGHLAAQS